ncbi:bifunctional diaminohydroxyphosphoribosylaminopyrimidine deaminase/5-amino-6-(5-phosphoribosylamino)uracil reductase RibD [Aureimonas phyllosphaerae]|uniref:Riboflavin biosynthesis protein RibD n=1 Tax=Aureimonas phyllosphaerae TaxID=1166078 RepID=A0A7W6FUM3_9HYPH|nr:bifunctional diaminohydroxyphosphoribosylaminopyrimidine deaminase/5-amino-6-(5-phosphoribosylamino)uracil reductase RibD [Aureimonas phyllosphaerae]MBB3935177.1 diaminohydroxyphosphoribosylaminopyrimidine deaminase/5-amino-6-(5-phosphoribosylamino)uracil reductase [Aureimonas phyllosphaerae]MBB3959185.1 diaminohydroxyphosphoribosylaminopyrimidine deaminase/5-amino-6-(5-phosphoribosylamino)uracil reductase [Aureimonas phyllosphaerae]
MADSTDRQHADDERFMAVARRLSLRHVGLTAENPSVGALLVQGSGATARVVGRGVTAWGGRPHAERVALADAGADARGSTAYVTLEPCAHHGRTSPCADSLVEAGVSRVVVGAPDPDPRVNGRGVEILRAAGIEVRCLSGEGVVTRPFEGFLQRLRFGRPFVTLKMAVSRDGFVGRLGGERIGISGRIANRQVHLLRANSDAIMVGVGTAVADDPLLTCRLPGLSGRSPIRIVVDPQLRLPLDAQLVTTARSVPTLIASTRNPDGAEAVPYRRAGCRLLRLSGYDRDDLRRLLHAMPSAGVQTLMVEGGPVLAAAFLEAELVDRIVVIRSPVEIRSSGVAAPDGVLAPNNFRLARRERFGDDDWSEWERIEPCSPESSPTLDALPASNL